LATGWDLLVVVGHGKANDEFELDKEELIDESVVVVVVVVTVLDLLVALVRKKRGDSGSNMFSVVTVSIGLILFTLKSQLFMILADSLSSDVRLLALFLALSLIWLGVTPFFWNLVWASSCCASSNGRLDGNGGGLACCCIA